MICYRVLGRGEDFIVGMLRAVKVGFGGAHSSDVQAMCRDTEERAGIKIGANRSKLYQAGRCCWSFVDVQAAVVCMLSAKPNVPSFGGLSAAARTVA